MSRNPNHIPRRWELCQRCGWTVVVGEHDEADCDAASAERPDLSHQETQTMTQQLNIAQTITEDVVRRGIKRALPCELTEQEFVQISRTCVAKKRELRQLEADFAKEKERRKEQIDEIAEEIQKLERELDTGKQERTVPCNEVFRRLLDDRALETGYIFTIRQDTHGEVERRPATPSEMQRYIPGTEPPPSTEKPEKQPKPGKAKPSKRSVLDEAKERQAAPVSAPAEVESADEDELPSLDESEGGAADPDASGIEAEVVDVGPQNIGELPSKPEQKSKSEGASTFGSGERVTWTSQAGGRETKKTGEIVAVVPVGKTPGSIDRERFKKFTTARQHESYIVDVDGELYWPVVSRLKAAKGRK